MMPSVLPPLSSYGFSLVELSIVLVILGLLTGGILGGQSLIKAAELRAIGTEYETYQIAINTFKQKYFAAPGDMTNATSFWGRADNGSFSGQCGDPAGDEGEGTETCNGDGNGLVGEWTPSAYYEAFRFWQHLANAGLIAGTYTGVPGDGGYAQHIDGENSPASKYSGGGWSIEEIHDHGGDSNFYAIDYGNYLELGAATALSCHEGPLLTPEEVWHIDTKVDDGKPGKGRVIAGNWGDCTLAANANDTESDYDLSRSDEVCFVSFIKVF